MGSQSIAHEGYRPLASWAIDSEAMRARRIIIIVLAKSNYLVKNNETKQLKARLKSFFAAKNPALFATSGL